MRRDAIASQAGHNAAGELGKPPFGSRIPASRGIEAPRRCFGIARGPAPAEKPGYGIVGVSYVGFYPLEPRELGLKRHQAVKVAGRGERVDVGKRRGHAPDRRLVAPPAKPKRVAKAAVRRRNRFPKLNNVFASRSLRLFDRAAWRIVHNRPRRKLIGPLDYGRLRPHRSLVLGTFADVGSTRKGGTGTRSQPRFTPPRAPRPP